MFIQAYTTDQKDYILKYKDFDDTMVGLEQMAEWVLQQSFEKSVSKIVVKKFVGNKPDSK